MGYPNSWMVYFMENPNNQLQQNDDCWGYPPFMATPRYIAGDDAPASRRVSQDKKRTIRSNLLCPGVSPVRHEEMGGEVSGEKSG